MKAVLHAAERLEVAFAGLCLAAAALGLCADVISREIIGQGLYGVQKFAVYCCAISGGLGISVVVHRGGHLRITAIDELVPDRMAAPFARIGDLVSAAICAALAYFSAVFVYDTFTFNETDTILNVPIWRIQIVLPIAFGFAMIKYLLHAAVPSSKPTEGAF
jgi:TRAP-type C4-dicarboxylate transport system permease small subunit